MAYSNKVIDHYENPRNVGALPKEDPNVGTGLVGELGARNLAGARLREARDDVDPARDHVAREPVAAVPHEPVDELGVVLPRDDDRVQPVRQLGVGLGENRHLGHARMRADDRLDLAELDAVAVELDLVIAPAMGASGWMQPRKIPSFFEAGDQSTREALPELQRLIAP